jgi:hypothetical protein
MSAASSRWKGRQACSTRVRRKAATRAWSGFIVKSAELNEVDRSLALLIHQCGGIGALEIGRSSALEPVSRAFHSK